MVKFAGKSSPAAKKALTAASSLAVKRPSITAMFSAYTFIVVFVLIDIASA